MKFKRTLQIGALVVVCGLTMGASCDKLQQTASTLNRSGSSVGDLVGAGVGGSSGSKAGDITDATIGIAKTASLTPEQEQSIGQSVGIALSNSPGLVKNQKLTDYVIKVGLTVASACPRDDIAFTFGVLDTDDVNAYSAPHGYVFVTRGALALMQDESELAGVLGHEIGHIVKNHGIDALKQKGYTNSFAKIAVAASGQSGTLVDLLKDTTKTLLTTSWDQSQEYAADQEAVKYVKAAGYDPRGYARFLSRLPTSSGKLFSTHPRSDDRITKVTAAIGPNAGGATLSARFKAATTAR